MILDSNVLIEVIQQPASPINGWLYEHRASDLRINPIIFAELSPSFDNCDQLAAYLDFIGIQIEPLTLEECHRGGRAFAQYRRRGGARTTILPDFLIGAQAAIRGWPLVTRDRKGFASYFPELTIIDPTDHTT
jgi:predicted nucleic acid-binding protein